MIRILWSTAGGLALALGVVGIALPLLPTTPFLLLAALCFARSSPRLEIWLIEHPRFGPPIRDWRAEGAIAPRAKALAMLAIAATFGLSLALQLPLRVLAIQAVTLGLVTIFILSRPRPRPALREAAPES